MNILKNVFSCICSFVFVSLGSKGATLGITPSGLQATEVPSIYLGLPYAKHTLSYLS